MTITAAVSVLDACSGGWSQLAPTTPTAKSAVGSSWSTRSFNLPSTMQRGVAPNTTHTDKTRSWMATDAKKESLIYISDQQAGSVYVYLRRNGKLVGTLTGFSMPQGLCVDKAGNIFVTNANDSNILEYAHGGTVPIATLSDSTESNVAVPVGCSVDPTTGNLAVANVTTADQLGDIAIYQNAKGGPTLYEAPPGTGSALWVTVNTCGYDNDGNLFFAGDQSFRKTADGELAKGASSTENITLNQKFGGPGQVQWDGTYMTFADQSTGNIYRFSISGSNATEVGSVLLGGSGQVDQSWIQGKKVIAPQQSGSDVLFYKYPEGGSATEETITGLESPYGAAVSLKH